MKELKKMWIGVVFLLLLLIVGANFYVSNRENMDGDFYKVEIKRMADEIKKIGVDAVDKQKYPTIKQVEVLRTEDDINREKHMEYFQIFLEESDYVYQIRQINGDYYRFDIDTNKERGIKTLHLVLNITLIIMAAGILMVLWYIKRKVFIPFQKIKEIPYELAKGNLTMPLTVEKNKYFGDFIWGLNLLREHLEHQKELCLSLQKDKSMLLLSLSHDIKTPLSAIKLYAKALSKNLYTDKERQKEVAENINGKADEIESFVNQIIQNTSEEFMEFTVEDGEFYLSEAMDKIGTYYKDKLSYRHTEFFISTYGNCLLKGDRERFIEVLENIMENAIKYGDGREICIDFSQEEDCQLIWITNSGNTLPEQEMTHIFDSFWRGSNTKGIEGSGLGLSICRKLMQKMKGDIFVTGKEDSFTITAVIPKK